MLFRSPAMLSVTPNDLAASDGTLGTHHSGAQSTADGTCADHSETIGPGNPLLAGSDCPPTWGSAGWQGSRNVDQDGYLAWMAEVGPSNFRFDPWRVPEELHRNDKFMGDFQTYGFFRDYSADALFGSAANPMAYNNVTPLGDPGTPPTRPGWPLGLEWKFDIFTFQAPALANIIFYQLTVTNRSQDVYGVPVNYDSLYMGITPGYLTNGELQGTSIYHDPANGVVRWANHCTSEDGGGCGAGSQQAPAGGDPFHPGNQWGSCPPGGAACGFTYGAGAFVILKSPIGDLRNKLFTRSGSPFEGAGDPSLWDDTITFNHGRQCGFHSCSRNTWDRDPGTPPPADTDYEQRQYGMVASIAKDALGDRVATDATSLPGHIAWDTFRWQDYPDRTRLDFNKYVPGGWDYNEDGVPDTLYLSSCTGNPPPVSQPGARGCVVPWSDTLPGGFGNVYCNEGCVIGAGPFPLAAGETTQFVYAMVMAEDSVAIEAGIEAAIDHYLSFYLGPEAPPPPRIVSTDVVPGGLFAVPQGAGAAEVRLYLDDAAEAWRDPFLEKFRNDLLAAPAGTDLGNLRRLNPWLADTLAVLIENNVAFIHIFKSCDGGTTFTDDADCNGDPATGGPFGPLGWLPYRTLRVGPDGTHAHTVVDPEVIGGRTYLYSVVAQSRGARFALATGAVLDSVISGTDTTWTCVAGCGATELEIAPSLLRSISRSTTEPFVAAVYVPVSQQAGSSGERAPRIVLVSGSPDFVPFDRLGVRLASDAVVDGRYRVVFGDRVEVRERAVETATGFDIDTTKVFVYDGGVLQDSFIRVSPAAVAINGAAFGASVSGGIRTRTATFDRLTAVTVTEAGVPLLVSSVLDGANTVPGSFFGLPDFPRFTLAIDNSVAGQFARQTYFTAGRQEIAPLVTPSVSWRPGDAVLEAPGGTYVFEWQDDAFGPGSPFTLDFTNPDGTREAIFNSVDSRATAQTASVDPAVLGILVLDPSQVVASRLPFRVSNVTTGTPVPVQVVVFRRASDLLLVGTGLDTLFAPVPSDAWLPNDVIALVDTDPLRVAFGSARLACDPQTWLRTTCNPVRLGTRGAGNGYVPVRGGTSLEIVYHLPLTPATEFTFDVQSRVTGRALRADRAAIRASLDSVKVVPNPFLLFSQYAVNANEPRIYFTHVPPRGVVRVFTVAGHFVQEIRWEPENLNGRGDLAFNLRTREGNVMAAGLYLYVLSALDENGGEIGRTIGKFVVVQ